MKKIYLFLILCVMCIALASCGNKEKDYQKQYMEACANNDFAKANAIVDMMEVDCKSEDLEKDIRTHRNYVIEKEVLYLVAQGTEESANRLLFLFKENDSFGWDRLLELAISQGNEYLATKIVDASDVISVQGVEAAIRNNMHKLADNLLTKDIKKYANNLVVINYVVENDKIDLVKSMLDIEPAVIYTNTTISDYCKNKNIYNKYVRNYLNSQMVALNKNAPSKPQVGLIRVIRAQDESDFSDFIEYNKEVKVHNSNCCMLIDIAIKLGDLKSAKKAKSLAKPLLKWTLLGDWAQVVHKCRTCSSIYDAYRVSFDNSSITKVNNYFNEAFRQ